MLSQKDYCASQARLEFHSMAGWEKLYQPPPPPPPTIENEMRETSVREREGKGEKETVVKMS